MFFQELSALAENLDVQIRLMKKGDSLTVSIVPAEATSIKPLSLTGTAAELDAGFLEAISAPMEAASIKDQVAAYKKTYEQELTEKKKAAATEVEKEAEKKETAEVSKPAKSPAKKRASKKDAAAETKETLPAEEQEPTAKSPAKKEAYAPQEPAEQPVNPEETDDPNDFDLPVVPTQESKPETLPAEPEPAPAQEPSLREYNAQLLEESRKTESPSELEKKVLKTPEAIAEDFTALAESAINQPEPEPVATLPEPEEEDSFFAPPPMPIPLFD